jgi:hypothetical protein
MPYWITKEAHSLEEDSSEKQLIVLNDKVPGRYWTIN